MENVDARCELLQLHRHYSEIGTNTRCCVCSKRIDAFAFVRYPDGLLAHVSCVASKMDVHPLTGLPLKSIGV